MGLLNEPARGAAQQGRPSAEALARVNDPAWLQQQIQLAQKTIAMPLPPDAKATWQSYLNDLTTKLASLQG